MIGALKRIDWRIFFILLALGLLGVVAVLPYVGDLLRSVPLGQGRATTMSFPLVVLLTLVQNTIVFSVVILAGLGLSQRLGLQMPLIRVWAGRAPLPDVKTLITAGLVAGAIVGILLVLVEAVFFLRHLPPAMHPLFAIPLYKRLLASLYGGTAEELFMRFFLLSLVAWLLGRWWRGGDGRPTNGAFWAAIIVVALLFGLGHLPATAALTRLTPLLVVRALVLNGIAGVAFGYLYWRRGLEAAMVAHMTADVLLQGPGIMLLGKML